MITGMPRIAIAVHDYPAVVSLFRDKFGMPVIDLSKSSTPEYGAALGMCVPEGGSNIELMSPVDPDTPLSKSLQGFLDRRGEGLFALMLEAPVPDDEAEVLADRGLNVMPLMPGAFGRDVHPSSTHGVLIRVYPVDSFKGQYKGPVDDRDGPQVSGISRVIIAVEDLDHAVEAYGTQFNMAMDETELDVERGVRSAICRPASGGVIELVAVEDPALPFANAIANFLEHRREGMYALVLQTSNISATQKMLLERGLDVAISADSSDVLEVDQAATFGALIRIEAR
ncbi:MAG: VOC family protein [Porticoccaceae bacterium]|nr:VOC family protein [Porticoccaceae bacterium]